MPGWKTLKPFLSLLLLLFTADRAMATPGAVQLLTGAVTHSVWDTDAGRIGVSIELINRGPDVAGAVTVTAIRITNGASVTPLPIALGPLPRNATAAIPFTVTVPPGRFVAVLSGTYVHNGKTFGFSVNRSVTPQPPVLAPVVARTGSIMVKQPTVGPYPVPPPILRFGPNAKTPILIPPGPPRRVLPPTPSATGLSTPGGSIVFPVNTVNANNAGTPPDPSAAVAGAGGVVLAAYNTGIQFSTNGGATFTDVNLLAPVPGQPARTTFFPQDDGGLCCDQVVIYLPQQNLFMWLLQYNPITACATNCTPAPGATSTFVITQSSRLRVAWATPAQIARGFFNAWSYVDLTATARPGVGDGLGVPNNEWLDYPDLGFSGRWLYVGVDRGFPTPGSVYTGRRIVARLNLAEMADPASTTVGYQWAELSGSNGLNKNHFVQNAPGRMVVGALDNTSTLRIFTWDDNVNTIPAPQTLAISSFQNGAAYNAATPDGVNFIANSFPGKIEGGTFRRRALFGAPPAEEYTLSFSAGSDGAGRPRPFVRLETLRPTGPATYAVSEEYDIWHPDYAYAMAALGTGTNITTPDIGLSLFVGSGAIGYPQGVVGFKDAFVVYQVTNGTGVQQSRFGDYINTRPVPGTESRFGTQTYEVLLPAGAPAGSSCATQACNARMRYVEWDRPPFVPPR